MLGRYKVQLDEHKKNHNICKIENFYQIYDFFLI